MKKIKNIKKIAAVLLSVAGVSAMSAGVTGCIKSSTTVPVPDNIEITKVAPPADGSLPTAHTCAENLSYINYVFDRQTQYHTYSYGVTSASIAVQTTRTFRDFKDGVLITTDFTHSSIIKSGSQTCTVFNEEGEGEVYFRTSEAPKADTIPTEAVWDENAPTHFSQNAYHYTYGLLPTELFNYITNENTVITSGEVQVNPDGTYSQSFSLDPVASTYFYQFGMKTRGGLSSYPDFSNISFTITFDGDWQILSSSMHEVAKVNKGILVDSISDFTCEYWYGEDHFDRGHYDYYENYYKKFLGDENLEQGGADDEKLVVDVTNVLSNGFSQILDGGQQFEVTLNLGGNIYKGYIFLSLDLADPLGTLEVKASLGRNLKNLNLYIEYGQDGLCAYYGEDFALSANIAEVKLAVGEFGEIIDGIKAALAKGADTSEEAPTGSVETDTAEEEGEDPLGALMNQMVLTATENQATLVLDTDDLLGLGVGIDATLKFGISGNSIMFRGAAIGGISLGGEELDLSVNLSTTTTPLISRDEGRQYADLADYIADVHSLLSSDLIKVHAVIDGNAEKVNVSALKGLKADVTAFADINGITVGAIAEVSYNYNGTPISATVRIDYGYNGAIGGYGEAVLTLSELNGKELNLKLGCNVSELVDAIGTLISFGGGESKPTRSLVQTLNGALSQNFTNLLTELYADNAKIKIGLSVDELLSLLSIDAGVKFGSCTLVYERGEGGGLSAALPALGFEMSVCGADGELSPLDRSDALDLVYVIDDVKQIINSDLIRLNINLDGKDCAVSALNGLKADLTAYFNAEQIALAATANVSYTLGEDTVSAALSVNYDNALNSALVSIDDINGVALNAKVKCNIGEIATAVTKLLQYADVKTTPFETGGFDLNGIVSGLLSADLDKLLPVAENTDRTLDLALDLDELLNILNVNLGTELGRLSLAYDHGADEKLVAKMPALGLSVDVSGENGAIDAPDYEGALDLTDLVNTVNAAIEQVNGIIDGKALAFDIERGATFLSLDGIVVEIWGQGEISWQQKNEYVALNLSMAITEGKKNSDISTLRLVYDKNADDTPFIRLALNQVGLDIYKDDIERVKNGFNEIYDKIKVLFGAEETPAPDAANGETSLDESVDFSAATLSDEISGKDALISILFGLISSRDWVEVLNNFTLTSDGKSVALDYLNANSGNGANIELGADGGLSLAYGAKLGARFTLGGSVNVSALGNSMLDSLNGEFADNCTIVSSKDGGAGFVHLAYDFLFDAIHYIGVENILGSDTYSVTFMLDGDNTNIEALQGVYVQAEIYITGAGEDNGKLAEGLLKVEVDGVGIDLHVITERSYNPLTERENAYFYMNLKQVASVKLPDLKMVATQDSLFDTFDILYKTVNDTSIIDLIADLIPSGNTDADDKETPEASDKNDAKEEDKLKVVADLLGKILDFKFSDAFVGAETDGVFDGTIYLDNIFSQLGIDTGTLGNLSVKINHNDHSMTSSGKTQKLNAEGAAEDKTWVTLASALTERRSYAEFKREQYISIEFLPALIEDVVNMATDDEGNVYEKFTFSGKITAKAGISFINVDINLDIFTLTAGFDQNGGLFVSAVFHIERVSALGLVTIPEGTLGLTYKNGYLTLARNLTGTPEYKVMTFDYFVDHMLTDEKSSVLRWWLNVSGWDTLLGVLKLIPSLDLNNINSGLTTPENVYLYKASAAKEEKEISMYDYVDALRVVTNGNVSANFGDISPLQDEFKIYDDYYGFALNAKRISNGVLTKLYAALIRSNGEGIKQIKASGAIESYVTFSATLNYKEGLTDEYQVGTALTGEKTAPAFYDNAMAMAEAANFNVDFDHYVKKTAEGYDEKFGCFSTASMSVDYSHQLYTHKLTIVNADGTTTTRDVRHGSTIYLYDNYSPLYTDNSKAFRILYSTDGKEVGATTTVMNGDLTVYALTRASVTVTAYSGDAEYTVNSFVGDTVPTKIKGLETIDRPTYADGTAVGDNDIIAEGTTHIKIYGTFVLSETEVNFVKYAFSAETMAYTAVGKAAGFNDYYSEKGNTLVLENSIGGYPVIAIGEGAFANTDGHPISKVVIPANIKTVGAKAFANNFGMDTAVFLADNVTLLGTAGKNNNSDLDQPFYGCAATEGGTTTNLKIYYNTITFGGSTTDTTWTKFALAESLAIKHRYYIGNKPSGENSYAHNGGGALYKGGWEYVEFAVAVDTNGVENSALTVESVSKTLAAHYPVWVVGSYAGSSSEQLAQQALVGSFANYEFEDGHLLYTCKYEVSYAKNGNNVLVANYTVSYVKAERAKVVSPVECRYNGSLLAAGSSIEVLKAEGEELTAPVATSFLYWFTGWSYADGTYTATWHQRATFNLTIKLNRGFTDTNRVHVITNGVKPSDGIRVNGGSASAATVTTIVVYEGEVVFSIADDELTIVTGDITYVIYVNEAKISGADKGNKRGNLKSTLMDTQNVAGNIELTLSYS